MLLLYEPSGWSLQINIGAWFISLYLDPRKWGFAYHRDNTMLQI